MPWGAAIGAAGAIGGALINKNSAKQSAEAMSKAGQLDPRIASLLFGENGQQGLISEYRDLGKTPRSDAALGFAGANADYLTNNGGADLGAIRNAAMQSMGGNSAPMSTAAQAAPGPSMTAAQSAGAPQLNPAQSASAAIGAASYGLPSYATGNMVQAPGQNTMDLTSSFDSLINGPAGANPYLTGAIGKGINQSNAAFGNMLTDAKSATQDLLGGIRGGAIAAGQFGGSRQGLAEGKALDSFNTNVSRAMSQFGQNNTDAAVAAQAGAYDADRNRQLSATQGLSGQQYATAFQDANTKNQAEFMNVNNQLDTVKNNAAMQQQTNLANLGTIHATNMANLDARQNTNVLNANLGQQNNQFNAGLQQQAGQFNAGQAQQNNQFNAGLQQNTNLANQQSQLTTNGQNNSSMLGGAGLLSGLLGQVSGTVNANDNWDITRAGQINSLLGPLIGASPTQNPVSANSGAAALGGGLAGLSLGNSLAGLFGGGQSSQFQGEKMGDLGSLGSLFGSGSYF